MSQRVCILFFCVILIVTPGARSEGVAAELTEESARAIYKARRKAIQTILTAAESEDPFIRANAIEAGAWLDNARLGALVKLGLEDEAAVVRFAALLTIGNEKLSDYVGSAPMAGLLASDDPSARSNAALLLGRMGDRSAVPMLQAMSRRPMRRVSAARAAVVRLQFAEAMVRLGDDKGLDALRAGAYSQFDEVRIVAIKDERHPIQVRLAAAESLARFRQHDGVQVLLEALVSTEATVRVQAGLTAAKLPTDTVILAVINQLDDEDKAAKLAAAAAVLAIAASGT